MLLLIHGEDTFRSHQRLAELKRAFKQEDPSETNLAIFQEGVDLENLQSQIQIAPFGAPKRLVIIKNSLVKKKINPKDLKPLFLDLPKTTDLIFYEEKEVDKKIVEIFPQVESFKPLKGQALERWIETEVKKQGGRIEKAAVAKLALSVGSDLWQLASEIEKLLLFKSYNSKGQSQQPVILVEDVDYLVSANFETSIFDLIDALGERKSSQAMRLLSKLLTRGEDPLAILGMIIWQFRNLILIKTLVAQKKPLFEIVKQANLHPFVVQKSLAQSRNFDFPYLLKIYQKLEEVDLALKTGQLEPELALDLLVVGLCGR